MEKGWSNGTFNRRLLYLFTLVAVVVFFFSQCSLQPAHSAGGMPPTHQEPSVTIIVAIILLILLAVRDLYGRAVRWAFRRSLKGMADGMGLSP